MFTVYNLKTGYEYVNASILRFVVCCWLAFDLFLVRIPNLSARAFYQCFLFVIQINSSLSSIISKCIWCGTLRAHSQYQSYRLYFYHLLFFLFVFVNSINTYPKSNTISALSKASLKQLKVKGFDFGFTKHFCYSSPPLVILLVEFHMKRTKFLVSLSGV